MNYRTDLILGEAFCIFFHFPVSGLAVLTSLHFYTFSPPRETYPKHSVGAEGVFDLRSILPALHNHWLVYVFVELLWTVHNTLTTIRSVPISSMLLTNKNVAFIYSVTISKGTENKGLCTIRGLST